MESADVVYAPNGMLDQKLDSLCYSGAVFCFFFEAFLSFAFLHSKLQLKNFQSTGTMSDETPLNHPLVILGPPGVGKTAYVANWIKKREAQQKRLHAAEKEFLFYHNCG